VQLPPIQIWKNSTGKAKQAEFYAYFKIIDAGLANAPKESYAQKNYAKFENFRFCTFLQAFA
jgi:hypothetical protein